MVKSGKRATARFSIRQGYCAERRIQGALDKVAIPAESIESHPASM